jgi:hypothetical protein
LHFFIMPQLNSLIITESRGKDIDWRIAGISASNASPYLAFAVLVRSMLHLNIHRIIRIRTGSGPDSETAMRPRAWYRLMAAGL